MQYGISPKNIINGVLACLKYDYPQDNQALELQEMIKSKGIAYTIESVCKLNPSDELSEMIIKEWERMR
jgi:mannitol-1-phosphate 5-dehydrogenase